MLKTYTTIEGTKLFGMKHVLVIVNYKSSICMRDFRQS